jgi:hypothetical protein
MPLFELAKEKSLGPNDEVWKEMDKPFLHLCVDHLKLWDPESQ